MYTFPELDQFPKYKELRDSQPIIKNQDFIPIKLDNIFSFDELNSIKKTMTSFPKEKIRVQKWGGQGVLDHINIPSNIKNKIEEISSKVCNQELVLAELSVVRYSPEYGWEVKLFPHYDTRPVEMFILDIQLQTNEDWGIIVEGKQFNLVDNQALLFSGTQQMHWREKKILSDTAEIYMMFCWLKHKNERVLSQEESDIMLQRQIILQEETNILGDESQRGKV